jgi:hypothetical protein
VRRREIQTYEVRKFHAKLIFTYHNLPKSYVINANESMWLVSGNRDELLIQNERRSVQSWICVAAERPSLPEPPRPIGGLTGKFSHEGLTFTCSKMVMARNVHDAVCYIVRQL